MISRILKCRSIFILLTLIFFSSAISHAQPRPIQDGWVLLSGNIDQVYFEKFTNESARGSKIILSSSGGDPVLALDIYRLIRDKNSEIQIASLCLSACAEILLPASLKFAKATFGYMPLIGFHQNSELFRSALPKESEYLFNQCFKKLNDRFLLFSKDVNRNISSFKWQASAISVENDSSVIANDCKSSSLKYKRRYWFPTGPQLEMIYNAKLPGPVCADSLKCIITVLSVMGNNGDIFLIGDTEYFIVKDNNVRARVIKGEKIDIIK